jgi:hypothetical protein
VDWGCYWVRVFNFFYTRRHLCVSFGCRIWIATRLNQCGVRKRKLPLLTQLAKTQFSFTYINLNDVYSGNRDSSLSPLCASSFHSQFYLSSVIKYMNGKNSSLCEVELKCCIMICKNLPWLLLAHFRLVSCLKDRNYTVIVINLVSCFADLHVHTPWILILRILSRHGLVGTATGQGAGWDRQGQDILYSPKRADGQWGPLGFLLNGYRGFLLRKVAEAWIWDLALSSGYIEN